MDSRPTQPLPSQQRTPIVDILRGWALLGVALGNFVSFYHLGASPEREKDTLSSILEYVMQYLFAGKSWTLLSVLFGYGFSVLIRHIADRTGRPISFFLKRMTWLLAFAFLNSLVFYGDILRDYAVLGMLMLVFYRSSPKVLVRTSIVLILIVPLVSAYLRSYGISHQTELDKLAPAFQSHQWLEIFQFNLKATWVSEIQNPQYAITVHLVMLSCMLLGVAAHRSDFFQRLATHPTLARRIFWPSLGLAVALNATLFHMNESKAPLLTYFRFGYWGVISSMIAIASGICWLHCTGRLKSLSMYLQDAGRMTLTNYMAQCLLFPLIFSGAGLGILNTRPYRFYLLLAIGIYVVQVLLSKLWLSHFQYGPVEWLWRRQSYGAGIAPIRRLKRAQSSA